MKIGMIGLGKIGLALARNLIDRGHDVVGYRRSAMDDFVAMGGTAAASPAAVAAACDLVFSCMPDSTALGAILTGENGVLEAARPGLIIAELGSHALADKEAFVAPLAAAGVVLLDGEVAGTPGMVAARDANIFLAGPRDAVDRIAPAARDAAGQSLYLGRFGSATKVKLANNILVALDIAGVAQAIAFGLQLGVDKDLLLQALLNGSGGSVQLTIRGPWMTARKFLPLQGPAQALKFHLEQAQLTARGSGIRTDIIDCLAGIYDRAVPLIGERDVAAMIEYFESQNPSNGAQA